MAYKKNLWFTLIAVLPVLALNVSAGNIVLNENTVGAKAMPAVIEDIAGTPFKMKTPERPTLPDRTVTVNKGSIGADGKITEAINGLIADISKSAVRTLDVRTHRAEKQRQPAFGRRRGDRVFRFDRRLSASRIHQA